MNNIKNTNNWLCLQQKGEQKTSREEELKSVLRALGFRRARVSYQLTAGIALLVVNGQPYGRYDFSRHTFVD